jgi:hypothetical protein
MQLRFLLLLLLLVPLVAPLGRAAAQSSGGLLEACGEELTACLIDSVCIDCIGPVLEITGGVRRLSDDALVDDSRDFVRSLQSSNSSSSSSSSSIDLGDVPDCILVTVFSGIQKSDCPENAIMEDLVTCAADFLACPLERAVCIEEESACLLDDGCSTCTLDAVATPPEEVITEDDCDYLATVEGELNGAPECTAAASLFGDWQSCLSTASDLCQDGDGAAITSAALSSISLAISIVVAVNVNA